MKIIVTGGASGVGAALVERLAEHEVWILDVQSPTGLADAHRFIPLDLSDAQAIDRVVADLPDALDGLANVAGIAQAPQPQTVVAVNFLGLRHLTESLLPRLVPGGRVVNVSSIAGRDWQSRVQWLLPLLETRSFAEGMKLVSGAPRGSGARPLHLLKATGHGIHAAGSARRRGERLPDQLRQPGADRYAAVSGVRVHHGQGAERLVAGAGWHGRTQ